jgi:predicted O-methyltransferase YrrM
MKSYRHWTPLYIKNRLELLYYEKRNPDHPWLTPSVIAILDSYLSKSDTGLEFGSGRSTLWFSRRIGFLTSVEHSAAWARKTRQALDEIGLNNVDYRHIPKQTEDGDPTNLAYVAVIDEFTNNSLDFCLVDGLYREFCVLKVLEKIRAGGLLVIDNVNWYLPCDSDSPNSRTFSDGPDGSNWEQVNRLLSSWRKIWTSSGVTDTAIFVKPCS